MGAAFAGEFFWKSVRDFRAWIGLVSLVVAGIGGAIGKPIILPMWVWLLIAFASAISMAIRAEWKAYREAKAQIEPDMKLVDVVKRIVGSDDILVGENCSKTGTALLTIRERGHLAKSPCGADVTCSPKSWTYTRAPRFRLNTGMDSTSTI